MKIIFLDIDGVLNSFNDFDEMFLEFQLTGVKRVVIDINKVLRLKEIIDKTGAKIVLISSWKKYLKRRGDTFITNNKNMQDIMDILNNNGIDIYDIAPSTLTSNREKEIRLWLKNKDVSNFIIIDDDAFTLESFIGKELVKTDFIKLDETGRGVSSLSGLTDTHVEEAISKLNNKVLLKM